MGECGNCDKSGYFTCYPGGGSEIECPFCNEIYSFEDNYEICDNSVRVKYNLDKELEKDLYYCYECHNIYMSGCTHADNGCSENIDNAIIVKIDDNIPKFRTFEGFVDGIKNKSLYGTCNCHNEKKRCIKEYYKRKEFSRCNINNIKFASVARNHLITEVNKIHENSSIEIKPKVDVDYKSEITSISLKNVSNPYDNNLSVLSNVNATFNIGNIVGIKGVSGSGK